MEEDEGPIEPQPRGIWPSMARDEGICMLPSLKLLLRRVCWTTLCAIALAGCGSTPPQRVRFTTDFASGSIGAVTQQDGTGHAWRLALRDDNANPSLPSRYRTWWHVRAENLPVGQPVRLEFSRLGFPYYFVPVYSHDGRTWQYFDEKDVTLAPGCVVSVPESCRLTVVKTFQHPTVWIARTFPYTSVDLAGFLASISGHPAVQVSALGLSPVLRLPIQQITIDDRTQLTPKKTVWIQARSHAAETGPSFVLEGLIRAVLADDALGHVLRRRFVFQIVPMHNPDGVDLGNYRTNGRSVNLEKQWHFTAPNAYLDGYAPMENRLLNHFGMVPVLQEQDAVAPVVLALNLHASNADADTAAFFYPHFGSDPARYTPAQQNLWQQQIAFIEAVARAYDGRIEQPPAEGGAGFLDFAFPETWWWTQRQDAVNAITLETVYGRAGFDHWVTQADLRKLGVAVARAIAQFDPPVAGVTSSARPAPGNPSGPAYRQQPRPDLYLLERE